MTAPLPDAVPSRRRVFVVVLDACGIGAAADAADYGDAAADTLGHLATRCGGLTLPTLARLGLGAIAPLRGVTAAGGPTAVHGRLHPLGPGKDSTAGHWELMGVVAQSAPPSYPHGLPPELAAALADATGHAILGNEACNGIEAIERWGARHLEHGALIVYTSTDSVLQIAAHVDRVPREELYAACAAARALMQGEHAVGRVIARPFEGRAGHFARTDGRRDFALAPPSRSYLDEVHDAGVPVHAVGKVAELFAHAGVDEHHPGPTNARAIAAVDRLIGRLDRGLVFANLVETDQVYGHRKDASGFELALEHIDAAVAAWLRRLREGDLLVLTADHGCDVTMPGTDHTREDVPLLAAAAGLPARRHDGPLADVGATALRWLTGGDAGSLPGSAFAG